MNQSNTIILNKYDYQYEMTLCALLNFLGYIYL